MAKGLKSGGRRNRFLPEGRTWDSLSVEERRAANRAYYAENRDRLLEKRELEKTVVIDKVKEFKPTTTQKQFVKAEE